MPSLGIPAACKRRSSGGRTTGFGAGRVISQTEIAAERLKVKCREDKLLAPGFSREALERLLKKYPAENLMIVGHEPDFTEVISALTGGSLKLPKAGVALVELNHSWRDGRLLWLIPPKVATK